MIALIAHSKMLSKQPAHLHSHITSPSHRQNTHTHANTNNPPLYLRLQPFIHSYSSVTFFYFPNIGGALGGCRTFTFFLSSLQLSSTAMIPFSFIGELCFLLSLFYHITIGWNRWMIDSLAYSPTHSLPRIDLGRLVWIQRKLNKVYDKTNKHAWIGNWIGWVMNNVDVIIVNE